MPQRDVASWTAILSAYVKSGNHEMALRVFDSMLISGQCPNEFTLSIVLRSCSAFGEFEYGTCIQARRWSQALPLYVDMVENQEGVVKVDEDLRETNAFMVVHGDLGIGIRFPSCW
ncbi:hypothetical protein F3Y22_tig00110348pilonHSYRG00047 [Hibiscus syriacus]|uniref:Uncharacterized protein n=1 Tax=Hibiscus syriacus TaxID=106335 RepID=A0A6A3AYQ2_HIBSY|nr:hypothetical protein F3Y22_tig00110348pilonHSYRG00047 [Hibiscus syriacus]